MDMWSSKAQVATWMVVSVLGVFSYEVTVKNSDLKLCRDNEKVCVTDLRYCGPGPPSSIQKTLNMSCYFEKSHRSMTCELSEEANSHIKPDVSLVFSRERRIISCQAIFNPASILNITARIKSFVMGSEIRSQPLTVFLYDAVKPSQPVLTVLSSTEDSVVVSWRSSSDDSCWLRYRDNNAQTSSQSLVSVPVHQDQVLVHTIGDLLPFTSYRAAVACRGESGIWSSWSPDVTVRTLDRVPSRPPEVCYRVEKTDPGGVPGSVSVRLMWKDLDPREAGGRILGYQVSYQPVKKQHLRDRTIPSVTETEALLVAEEGNYSVAVSAFNTAGSGPAARLSIDTQRQNNLRSVRNLWVSSLLPDIKGLRVQWEPPTAPPSALPVSHFDVQWRSETRPSSSRRSTVNGFNTSTVIQDVDPDDSYLISVVPVSEQQCGSPRSLPASLQQGALMEAVQLKVVSVTKTLVMVEWAWQRKSGSTAVSRYRVMLRKNSEGQQTIRAVSVWPDQWQHTFPHLRPNTEYHLLLMADNVSRNIITVRTGFDEVPVVATATPLLLLAVTVIIISILSRTVYKSYFFPPISSPWGSEAGRWLMGPNHQKSAERSILDIRDFQVTDILGEKSGIMVVPNSPLSSGEDVGKESSVLPLSHLIIDLDSQDVSDTEHQLRPHHVSDENQEADAALLHHMCEANGRFPCEEEEHRQLDPSDPAVKSHLHELLANTDSLSSAFQGETDETVSGQTDCPYLICETGYIANSCFTAEITDEDKAKQTVSVLQ
ncbi:interleukin-6 receptor subunit beta [Toxotes jaculatrix]|uniref:interleukin-6 receptor subunit beta n=1 Tax=Toxotes jaculatrix TaxID=941984 RepID=UPI001B3B0365|nr:interleukin-6 receptor subunit beta [Toxotes jaculatrix]